jgi:glycosyltransferase involved in cell wall biosynthesis
MAVWNGASHIGEAIRSVLEQSFTDFEFIIVDDGSTDDTAEVVAQSVSGDGRVRFLRREHEGMVPAFNCAYQNATSNYLVHLDADDLANPERLTSQLTFMEQHPEVGLLGSACRMIWPDGRVIQENVYPAEDPEIRSELAKSCCFCHSSIVIRKDAFDAAGGYQAAFRYSEDLDLYLRLAEVTKMANLDQVLVLYRVHGNQVCARNFEQGIISSLGTRIAAELRAKNRGDDSSLKNEVPLSRATLRQYGHTDEEIDTRILFALENNLRLALSPARPDGFEHVVNSVIESVREFCSRCSPDALQNTDLPNVKSVLGQPSLAQI